VGKIYFFMNKYTFFISILLFTFICLFFSFGPTHDLKANLAPATLKPLENADSRDYVETNNDQMLQLNFQFRTKTKTLRSNLSMPYYQVAEIEKSIDSKEYIFEIIPKKGKSSDEVLLEVRLKNQHAKNSKKSPNHRKEILVKFNEEARVTLKGITLRIQPELI